MRFYARWVSFSLLSFFVFGSDFIPFLSTFVEAVRSLWSGAYSVLLSVFKAVIGVSFYSAGTSFLTTTRTIGSMVPNVISASGSSVGLLYG